MFNYMSLDNTFDGVAHGRPANSTLVRECLGSIGSEASRDASSQRVMNVEPLLVLKFLISLIYSPYLMEWRGGRLAALLSWIRYKTVHLRRVS